MDNMKKLLDDYLKKSANNGINEEYDAVNKSMYFDKLEDIKQYCDDIVCYYSDNDPYVKYGAEKEFADTISTEQYCIHNGGHLNAESDYIEFKELLKYIWKWKYIRINKGIARFNLQFFYLFTRNSI